MRRAENQERLHTTVTLGYDVEWRRLHELLAEAACQRSESAGKHWIANARLCSPDAPRAS